MEATDRVSGTRLPAESESLFQWLLCPVSLWQLEKLEHVRLSVLGTDSGSGSFRGQRKTIDGCARAGQRVAVSSGTLSEVYSQAKSIRRLLLLQNWHWNREPNCASTLWLFACLAMPTAKEAYYTFSSRLNCFNLVDWRQKELLHRRSSLTLSCSLLLPNPLLVLKYEWARMCFVAS